MIVKAARDRQGINIPEANDRIPYHNYASQSLNVLIPMVTLNMKNAR